MDVLQLVCELGLVGIHDRARMVGAAIVHNDDFPIRVSLPNDAVNRTGQIGGRVISGYDDTDTGHHLQTNSSSAAISASTVSSAMTSTG